MYDSIFLRYIILFMGVGSSTYAIWDIITDGVIDHGKDDDEDASNRSDCEAMAIWYNESNNPVRPRVYSRSQLTFSLYRGPRNVLCSRHGIRKS